MLLSVPLGVTAGIFVFDVRVTFFGGVRCCGSTLVCITIESVIIVGKSKSGRMVFIDVFSVIECVLAVVPELTLGLKIVSNVVFSVPEIRENNVEKVIIATDSCLRFMLMI